MKAVREMDSQDVLAEMAEMSGGEAYKFIKMVLIAYFIKVWDINANPDNYMGYYDLCFDHLLRMSIEIEAEPKIIEAPHWVLNPDDIKIKFSTETRQHIYKDISPTSDDE